MKVFPLIVKILLMSATLTAASIHAANDRIALTILYCFLSWLIIVIVKDDSKN